MSYNYSEIKGGRKLSEMTAEEQAYIKREWDRLCARESYNTSERIFFQREDGRFIEAIRCRIAAIRGEGSAGGYWSIRYGNCRQWGFKKNPFGSYEAEAMNRYFSSRTFDDGTVVYIPSSVHTKKEVLDLARKLRFEF